MTPTRPRLVRRLVPGAVARRTGAGPGVRLTFDDGPHPDFTPVVLAALSAAGVRATFYVVGRRVERHPAVARAVVAAGHAVGNHTATHPPGRVGYRAYRADIAACQAAIARATGAAPAGFRPPLGRVTPVTVSAAWATGLRVETWSLDSNDWRCRSAAQAAECGRATAAAARPGDVILLHDANPWIEAVLATLLPGLAAAGLLGAGE